MIGVGTQLNTMPTRVTTFATEDSAVSEVMPEIAVKEPVGNSGSTPFCTWTCATLPSARAARNTALPLASGDLVMSAVASAGDVNPPGELGTRFVTLPANTPPAATLGAPASGTPLGSRTVIVPSPPLTGALANHGRPKPLLKEIPRGRLTPGSALVTALG